MLTKPRAVQTNQRSRDMSTKVLRLRAVREITGLSRSSIYAAIARGEFPRQVSLGARAVGWIEAEVLAWVEKRISVSRAAA